MSYSTSIIIPARAGSKGIPRKNLTLLGNKSLLRIAIETSLGCKSVEKVIVSTESEEIAAEALKYGAEVPFLRPEYLAKDNIHSSDVVFYYLDWMINTNQKPDNIVMLLPTSPLTKSSDIDFAINKLNIGKFDSVVGVVDTGKIITNFRYIKDNKMVYPFENIDKNMNRQFVEKVYAVNGSIFASKSEKFYEQRTFHLQNTYPYIMPSLQSIDINNVEDLKLANLVYDQKFVTET